MIDFGRIEVLRKAGQHEEARQELLELVSAHPESAEAHYQAASVHDYLGLEREAIPFYVAAIEKGISGEALRGAYLGLGSTYRTLGHYAESKQTFLEGLTHFPAANELSVFLAMTQFNLQEHHDAMRSLLNVIAETTNDHNTKQYARAIRLYAEDLTRQW